jgi:hypothetical protein
LILDNNNVATVGFTFVDAFPNSIGQIVLATTITGQEYLYCDVNFSYTYFNINKL